MSDASQQTRACVEFVCQALSAFGIPYVTSEHLRRAKHDEDGVAGVLWQLVLDLLTLCLAVARPDARTGRSVHDVLAPLEPAKEFLFADQRIPLHHAVRALSVLFALRYPRAHFLDPARDQSRELLLAVGFLLDRCDLLENFRRRRVDAEAQRQPVSALPPYPLDVCGLPEVVRPAQEDAAALAHRSARIEHAAHEGTAPGGVVEALCHSTIQLYAKWHLEAKRAENLDAHRLVLLQRLRAVSRALVAEVAAGRDESRVDPPSQYELFVLERPALLDDHVAALEARSEIHASWRHEERFWGWMASVLQAAEAARLDEGRKESRTPCVFGSGEDDTVTQAPPILDNLAKFTLTVDRFAETLPVLQRALRYGYLHGDARWCRVQESFDRIGDDWSCGNAERLPAFLRRYWDECREGLSAEVLRGTKPRLRASGLAFDAVMPAPWRTVPKLVSGSIMAALGNPTLLAPPDSPRMQCESDHRPDLRAYAEDVKSRYRRAVTECADAQQQAASAFDGCVETALPEGILVSRYPNRLRSGRRR